MSFLASAACGVGEPVHGAGSEGAKERVERRLFAMGTELGIEIDAQTRAVALKASEAALRATAEVEARLSTWRFDSELSALNRAPVGEPIPLSTALASELREALDWSRQTAGAFDPTLGAALDAWDLRGAGRVPSDSELAEALAHSGAAGFELRAAGSGEASSALRHSAGLRIEEGGFGKGAGLDAALAAAREAGATAARVDLGGQIAWFGGPATIGIADPLRRNEVLLELTLDGPAGSVATSGNSERALEVDGQRFGHLLDPRTGRPAADFGSVTVWVPATPASGGTVATDAAPGFALAADCLATALFVLGPDAGLDWAQRTGACEALYLISDGERATVRATARLSALLGPLSSQLAPGAGSKADHPSSRPSDALSSRQDPPL